MKNLILLFITFFAILNMQSAPTLIGMTYNGGANSGGTLIQYSTGNSGLTSHYSLHGTGHSGTQGNADPYGSIIQTSNGNLYGMTYQDGVNLSGTLFQFNYSTNTYTVQVNFDSISGYGPLGSLMQASNGLLYGLTSRGGIHGGGTLFSYTIGSNSVTKLADLPANAHPYGSLIQASDGNLYGMTKYDGTNNSGTIFEFDLSTNVYTVKYSLLAGAQPSGSLLEVGHDTLYGLTNGDGTNNMGTIFCYVPATNTYSICYNFAMATGGTPCSSLIHASDGLLYGTTALGGVFHDGVLFNYNINTQIYTDIHDFNGLDGRNPLSSIYQASDGLLYGMTGSGGTNSLGNIFEYNIGTNTLTSLISFNGTDGASPQFGGMTEYIGAPLITEHPLSQSTCPGTRVAFKASATYTTSAVWQVSSNGGQNFSTLPTTSDTLYVDATSGSNGNLYRAVFSNYLGSDTTPAAILTVFKPIENNVSVSICPGGSYNFGANTYTTSGIYSDTFANASINGCDSIVTLYLTVSPIMYDTVQATVCHSIGYTLGSNTYSGSGVYIDTISDNGNGGCKHVVVLNLTTIRSIDKNVTVSHDTFTAQQTGATYQWLSCDNHQAITGATSQSYTATSAGDYRCIVTVGTCQDTTDCVSVTTTGIIDAEAYGISIYPNPTSGLFMIEQKNKGVLHMHLISMLGSTIRKLTMTENNGQFDISDLASGIYRVQISDDKQILKTLKLVKE